MTAVINLDFDPIDDDRVTTFYLWVYQLSLFSAVQYREKNYYDKHLAKRIASLEKKKHRVSKTW